MLEELPHFNGLHSRGHELYTLSSSSPPTAPWESELWLSIST